MVQTSTRSIVVRFARVLTYLVYFWVVASLIILTLGFFLKLFGANPDAGFVEWVYRNLDRTMEPFRGMFPEQDLGDGASVLDVSILFAMLVYGFVALAFRALADWLTLRLNRINLELAQTEAQQEGPASATSWNTTYGTPQDQQGYGTAPGAGTQPGTYGGPVDPGSPAR